MRIIKGMRVKDVPLDESGVPTVCPVCFQEHDNMAASKVCAARLVETHEDMQAAMRDLETAHKLWHELAAQFEKYVDRLLTPEERKQVNDIAQEVAQQLGLKKRESRLDIEMPTHSSFLSPKIVRC